MDAAVAGCACAGVCAGGACDAGGYGGCVTGGGRMIGFASADCVVSEGGAAVSRAGCACGVGACACGALAGGRMTGFAGMGVGAAAVCTCVASVGVSENAGEGAGVVGGSDAVAPAVRMNGFDSGTDVDTEAVCSCAGACDVKVFGGSEGAGRMIGFDSTASVMRIGLCADEPGAGVSAAADILAPRAAAVSSALSTSAAGFVMCVIAGDGDGAGAAAGVGEGAGAGACARAGLGLEEDVGASAAEVCVSVPVAVVGAGRLMGAAAGAGVSTSAGEGASMGVGTRSIVAGGGVSAAACVSVSAAEGAAGVCVGMPIGGVGVSAIVDVSNGGGSKDGTCSGKKAAVDAGFIAENADCITD